MNHSIAYSDFLTVESSPRETSRELAYEHILAAISDINLTLPSHRSLRVEMNPTNAHCELYIIQKEFVIHTYYLRQKPSAFRRMLAQITLGFVRTETVELLKTDIEARYTYGERIIY